MALIAPEADEAQQIDEALAAWRQGDMARGPQPFVHPVSVKVVVAFSVSVLFMPPRLSLAACVRD